MPIMMRWSSSRRRLDHESVAEPVAEPIVEPVAKLVAEPSLGEPIAETGVEVVVPAVPVELTVPLVEAEVVRQPMPSNHAERKPAVRYHLANALPVALRDIEHVLSQHRAFLGGGGRGGTWQSMIASTEDNLAWMREQNLKWLAPTLRTGRLAVGVPFAMYVAHDLECDSAGEQAIFHLCNLDGASLADAMLMWADLTAVRAERADFSGADLRSAMLTDGLFSGTSFANADMRGADLSRGDFIGCDFTNADLRSADLENCDFTGANMSGARLFRTAGRPNGVIFDPGFWDEGT